MLQAVVSKNIALMKLHQYDNTDCIHAINENAEDLVAANKEIGLEVNADETKYMVMSRVKNAGRSHNIKW